MNADPRPIPDAAGGVERVERYELSGERLVRRLSRRDGTVSETDVGEAPTAPLAPAALHALADQRYLRTEERPADSSSVRALAVVDLFSGIGALSLGVTEGARALGLTARVVLAADADPAPLEVLSDSLEPLKEAPRCVDLGAALSGDGPEPNAAERALLSDCPDEIDILVAGPPCQGHSRLNNHTRHDDPRNDLYGCVARFIALKRPKFCIIENVDSVVHDQRQSAATVAAQLREMSYRVDTGTVPLHRLGVPQTRRRHVLIAVRADHDGMLVDEVVERFAIDDPERRTVRWAIEDLEDPSEQRSIDLPSRPTVVNQERIDWLHQAHKYNLPNDRRPDCHRLPKVIETGETREHSYRSMYGRLHWDQPAQTITSGYGSMGQGRYVHPASSRTLTPHEAARLQFVPDFIRFEAATGRGRWARMIGNVAPLKLSYIFALEFLR